MFFKKVRAKRGPYYETERGPSSSRSRRARGDRLETRLATARGVQVDQPSPGPAYSGDAVERKVLFFNLIF